MSIDERFDKIKKLAVELGPDHVYDLNVCIELLEMSLKSRLDFRMKVREIAND